MGKIYITDIRHCKSVPGAKIYAIVRSLKNPIQGVTQLPALSPSKNLFFAYLNLKKAGRWDRRSYEQVYTPRFLLEMQAPEARAALKQVADEAKVQDVVLACFCPDGLCHRFLVADILEKEYGARIEIL